MDLRLGFEVVYARNWYTIYARPKTCVVLQVWEDQNLYILPLKLCWSEIELLHNVHKIKIGLIRTISVSWSLLLYQKTSNNSNNKFKCESLKRNPFTKYINAYFITVLTLGSEPFIPLSFWINKATWLIESNSRFWVMEFSIMKHWIIAVFLSKYWYNNVYVCNCLFCPFWNIKGNPFLKFTNIEAVLHIIITLWKPRGSLT